MKLFKKKSKLELNKKVVTTLSEKEMNSILGGGESIRMADSLAAAIPTTTSDTRENIDTVGGGGGRI